MLIISHRGNLDGPNPVTENNPHQVMKAIYQGFDVEVDLWWKDNGLFLGHDEPKYKIDYWFLVNKHLWIHCKNIEAVTYLSSDDYLHLFYHEGKVAYTSKAFLITAPGEMTGFKSVACLPESVPDWNIKDAYAICTDYPLRYHDDICSNTIL